MSAETLTADYLVIGAGAMGMAFTDVLMTESDATVVMVDRHHQPGGHWNDAYPFVRLHQPSAFYGVNSRKLGSDSIDATGWNAGLYELATNSEVCAYFDQVMQQQFLASGRVQYLPMCEYANGRVVSRLSGAVHEVAAGTVVDSTYMNVTVPSMREPAYKVADGATCVPPNALPRVARRFDRFVVVGAGKTGMDACLFLLKNDVDPDRITWIMPRDSWLFDRANIQAGAMFEQSLGRGFLESSAALAGATSVDDLFARMNARGQLLRFDESVRPTMWRCATVTQAELAQLRRIRDVVRKGRVQRIDASSIALDQGTIPTSPATLHVDCTADGLERRPMKPVFAGNRITLQTVRACQQVFSAALIAHVEAAYDGEALKNELCTPVPHPDTDLDYLRATRGDLLNGARWAVDEGLRTWLANSRLDLYSQPGVTGAPGAGDAARAAALATAAANKLAALLAAVEA